MERIAINVLAIRDNEILLVKKNETWILPGGKPMEGESEMDCLQREIKEELPLVEVSNIRYFNDFVGITPHKGDMLRAKVYWGDVKGEIKPNAEINSAQWVKREKMEEYALSDITQKIVNALK
ncbi:hypothetical protein A2372_00760 [Candidatus Wolfebacteria bacterium RIFOXYB1_FULL_54_12]|uniref:Nudix hydrolase domain-containing protein n=1 Tax=Candidatus Wolfebacteria bacterium RIFOXYB1_FULL_54_12 TaxID=1802559 RepID=A0A1F8DVS9_9BACT|nr:MAG: hypothetical protein A2372_00760 [Candidatus Wolfebacteria bacterium RIFOXYB1_FULL_54_12]